MNKLIAYLLFLTSGAWLTIFFLLSSPSDVENATILGYSIKVILISSLIFLFSLAPLYLALKLFHQPQQCQTLWLSIFHNKRIPNLSLILSLIIFIGSWSILFTPPYRTANFTSYISRLHPILIWLTIVSAITFLISLFEHRQYSFTKILSANKSTIKIGGISLSLIILLSIIVALSGFGITHPEDYWYGAGVPILGQQLLFVFIITALVAKLEFRSRIKLELRHEALIGLGIFLVAAFFWMHEPIRSNYFLPDTMDNPIYPYSDSALFDTGSQYALIGQGLFNGQYFDRALYSAFLTYLHILVGQNFENLLNLQAIFFAIFPVIIFLIGKEIHSYTLGVSAGLLTILRGINSIVAMAWIDLAGPKMMMTDFPTAIGIALFILFALKWVKKPANLHFAVWCGGFLGLSMMLRTHVLLLLPALIAYILFFNVNISRSYRFIGSFILIIGMLTASTPWDIRNQSKGYPMFYMYYSRIWLVLKERYQIQGSSYLTSPYIELTSATTNQVSKTLATLPSNEIQDGICTSVICKLSNHMAHNLITSFVFFPSSLWLHNIWNTVKETSPFWQPNWGISDIPFSGYVFLFIHFTLFSLGIGSAWQKQKWLGLLPLGIFLVYLLTNTLALTSGGRYVAPVDWVVVLYSLLGSLQILIWLMRWIGYIPNKQEEYSQTEQPNTLHVKQFIKIAPALIMLVSIGSLIPLAENLFKPRYQIQSAEQLLTSLKESEFLEKSGYTQEELTQFLKDPQAVITAGKVLYPRFYEANSGEPDRSTYYRELEYARVVFTIIGPYTIESQGIILSIEKQKFQLDQSDVIVLGCKNTIYYAPFIDAVVVFVTSQPEYIYKRTPAPPLQCPVPFP